MLSALPYARVLLTKVSKVSLSRLHVAESRQTSLLYQKLLQEPGWWFRGFSFSLFISTSSLKRLNIPGSVQLPKKKKAKYVSLLNKLRYSYICYCSKREWSALTFCSPSKTGFDIGMSQALSFFLKACEALACAGLGASVQIQATKYHVRVRWINEALHDYIFQNYEGSFSCLRLDPKPTT